MGWNPCNALSSLLVLCSLELRKCHRWGLKNLRADFCGRVKPAIAAITPQAGGIKSDCKQCRRRIKNPIYYTILYYTILYYTILYYTILYYTKLYYTILYYTILYWTLLYSTLLYYTILRWRPRHFMDSFSERLMKAKTVMLATLQQPEHRNPPAASPRLKA